MKKILMLVSVLLVSNLVWASVPPAIDRGNLSLKAGSTEPGEPLSIVWLESLVYPKKVGGDRTILLGVRLTSRVKEVEAAFDFTGEKVKLDSNDGLNWNMSYRIPDEVAAGLHVARYHIVDDRGSIQRTVDFSLDDSATLAQNPNPFRMVRSEVKGWPLTVTQTGIAIQGGSTRMLQPGAKLTGIAKVPWYKVVFEDGKEGWIPLSMVVEPVEEYFQKGYAAYLAKNYNEAIANYKMVIEIDPTLVKGYLWLAKSYYQMGNLDETKRCVVEALRLDDRDMNLKVLAAMLAADYFKLAHIQYRAGDYQASITNYKQVLDLRSDSVLSWIELGKSYREMGMGQEARSAWREGFKRDPENKVLLSLLNIGVNNAPIEALKPKVPTLLVDDSLTMVKGGKTSKGTLIEAALKSVISLTRSLGTPMVEKGWAVKRDGANYLVRYLCEQGSGVLETFDWLVNVDSRAVSANNGNAKLLMDRW